jgi:hypothetical protein
MHLITPFYKKEQKVYLNLFFYSFRSGEEQNYFLKHFNDESLKLLIDQLILLFTKNSYKDIEIINFAKTYNININDLLKWQKGFYLIVCRDHRNSIFNKHFKDLINNKSLKFLLSLDDDESLIELILYSNTLNTSGKPLSTIELLEIEKKQKQFELFRAERKSIK